MGQPRAARGWRILLALSGVAALVAISDLSAHRRSAAARSDDYASQLFAGESGWAALTQPRLVSSWRVGAPAGRAALPDRQSVALLVALLRDGASYARGGAAPVRAYDVAVRFEDEHGSLTLLFTRDGAALEVMRDGSPLSQADTTPVRERLRALLPLLLGEPAGRAPR